MFSIENNDMSITDHELRTPSNDISYNYVYSQYDDIWSPFKILSSNSLYETLMGKIESPSIFSTISFSNIDIKEKLKLENIFKIDENQKINNQRTVDLSNHKHTNIANDSLDKSPFQTKPKSSRSKNDIGSVEKPRLYNFRTSIRNVSRTRSSINKKDDNIVYIGIYTRSERREKIKRYREKRKRYFERMKLGISAKNRYKCRSDFAKTRKRIGGRFI